MAWSEEDEVFIGRGAEFPSLAAHGDTQEKSLRAIRTLVGFVIDDLKESGEPVPEPLYW